jgi:UDP-N-acetyl-D-glucosamine dehydrogenase
MLYRAREKGVVGLQYVRLPLAVAFAEVGLRVDGIEKDSENIAVLDTCDSYVEDAPAEHLQPLVASGKLQFTGDCKALKGAGAVVICLPTPLNEHREPDLSMFSDGREVARNLRVGALVAPESITYPGTTREVLLPIIEEELKNGDSLRGDAYQVGREFYFAFAPERIGASNRRYSIHNIPKIVGGITSGCTRRAADLYSSEIEEVHSVSSPASVKMAKLLENILRGVNIAVVNELALLCDRMNVDVWEIIKAAKTKTFGFMPIYPGLGGHCIAINPFYLSWGARAFNMTTEFIELAGRVILWTIRALALHMTPAKYHRALLRGRGC